MYCLSRGCMSLHPSTTPMVDLRFIRARCGLASSSLLLILSWDSSVMLKSPSIMSGKGRFEAGLLHFSFRVSQNSAFFVVSFGAYTLSTRMVSLLCHLVSMRIARPGIISVVWVSSVGRSLEFITMATPFEFRFSGSIDEYIFSQWWRSFIWERSSSSRWVSWRARMLSLFSVISWLIWCHLLFGSKAELAPLPCMFRVAMVRFALVFFFFSFISSGISGMSLVLLGGVDSLLVLYGVSYLIWWS